MDSNFSGASRQPRILVSQSAMLRDAGGGEIACTILDVSHSGFRLKVPRIPPAGVDYSLHFDGEAHRIDIRWATGGEVGGIFLD